MIPRGRKCTLPDPPWFDNLREGAVLRSPSGALRVVRSITRNGDYDGPWGLRACRVRSNGKGALRGVMFVKRARSRYPSACTIYNATELRQGWQYTGVHVPLDSVIDKMVEDSIENRRGTCCEPLPYRPLTQDEAIGLP